MPYAIVSILCGLTYIGALSVFSKTNLCESELSTSRGKTEMLRPDYYLRGVQQKKCTNALTIG